MESKYYRKLNGTVECLLCPQNCIIQDGKYGICMVRKNQNGEIVPENYGKVSALHPDPIEKKPLYHFFPGQAILSIGTFGCNLKCKFCQNYDISQSKVTNLLNKETYKTEDIIRIAVEMEDNHGIAYTYNEPIIWFEFVMETATKAHHEGLYNVMVSNGFINEKPLFDLLHVIDAWNVDLKAFTEDFYRKYTSSKLLPVKESIKSIKKAGKHLEITNLVIPGLNDDENRFREMVKWISDETGKDTVLHISRYFPTFRMDIQATPVSTLERFHDIASEYLNYVFLGNVATSTGKDTYCPECNNLIISRSGYSTRINGLTTQGHCSNCDKKILEYV